MRMNGALRAWLCKILGCQQEQIIIHTPAATSMVSSPVSVTGHGRAAQHNQLFVEVRDSSNVVIGSGPASITGPLGQPGPFSASITFSPTMSGSPGFIQVFDTSPATGSMIHLSSVMVTFA
jgi:hypothetical protein